MRALKRYVRGGVPARRWVAAGAAVVGLAATAPPASADVTVGVNSRNMLVISADNVNVKEHNRVVVQEVPARLRVFDPEGVIPGPGCGHEGDPTTAVCTLSVFGEIHVSLHDGNDVLTSRTSKPITYQGGLGNDEYHGGTNTADRSEVSFFGQTGVDRAVYSGSTQAVTVSKDGKKNDGRINRDLDNIGSDVEEIVGSRFDDVLSGGPGVDRFEDGDGADVVTGGPGNDLFRTGSRANGADRIIGGADVDHVSYAGRTNGVNVNLSTGPGDGEPGENDELTQIEQVSGGSGSDRLEVFPNAILPVIFNGAGGSDTLVGGAAPDILQGNPGVDTLAGNGHNDRLVSRDNVRDNVDCGPGNFDVAEAETVDAIFGCETSQVRVGKLKLKPKSLAVEPGGKARMTVKWRHPRRWKDLRDIAVQLHDEEDNLLGQAAIKPRAKRAKATSIDLASNAKVTRSGKTVGARLALRIDGAYAGQRLRIDVAATDRKGRQQLERNAGSITVGE